MSVAYSAVQWNRHKRIYDILAAGSVLAFVAAFIAVTLAVQGDKAPTAPVMLLRGLGLCAITLLHVILAIGPLARLTPKASPLLYNRRHLGVLTFFVSLGHAALSTLYYGFFGDRNPVLVLLADNAQYTSLQGFPFEVLGFVALLILFLMAATSHDFWLKNLGPRTWKWLHMSVYAAYAALIFHVLLGTLRSEPSLWPPLLLATGVALIGGLHIIAATKSARAAAAALRSATPPQWFDACALSDIADRRAKIIQTPTGESIAVFRYDGRVSAVSNTCVHQGGPLGEGKIVNGCITCPWHGYQYLPDCGQSPPPFTEKIPTYEVRLRGQRIAINPRALPPGTPVPPAIVDPGAHQ